MPTYDYQCRQCGHTIEVIHSMRESGPERCERCGGELRRVLFPAGIIFKGSGFYKTDSRSAGSSSSTSSSKPAAASSGAEKKAPAADSGGDGSSAAGTPAKDAPKTESA
ncbi:MAG TPA: FmdB family zinc ribbon protein [Candidatus Limnocylindria bacterium]